MGLFKAIGGLVKKVAGPALSAIPGVGPIGSLALSAGSAFLGNKMDAARDRGALRDKYDFMESKGLTPQEIAGASFGANPSSSGASILGNQAAQQAQAQRQMDFQAAEREKDRALQVRAQDMGLQQSQTMAGAQMYGADVNAATAANNLGFQRERYNNIELPDALRRAVTESPAWKRQQLLATMGVDNVLGSAVSGMYGIDVMDPDSLKRLSTDEFMQLARTIYGMQSNAFGETAGGSMALRGAVKGFGMGAASVVGDQGGGSGGRRDRR